MICAHAFAIALFVALIKFGGRKKEKACLEGRFPLLWRGLRKSSENWTSLEEKESRENLAYKELLNRTEKYVKERGFDWEKVKGNVKQLYKGRLGPGENRKLEEET